MSPSAAHSMLERAVPPPSNLLRRKGAASCRSAISRLVPAMAQQWLRFGLRFYNIPAGVAGMES